MPGDIDPRVIQLFDFKSKKGSHQIVKIIEVTLRQISQIGIIQTNFGTISEELNTNRAHIVYYFKDLDNLLLESTKFILATIQGITVKNLSGVKSPRQQLECVVRSIFEWTRDHPTHLPAFLLLQYYSMFNSQFKEVNEASKALGRERMVAIFEASKKKATSDRTLMARVSAEIQDLVLGSITFSSKTGKKTELKVIEEACVLKSLELADIFF